MPAPINGPDLYQIRRAHLVGIGGTAMTPLATILLQMGKGVSGSDLTPNASMELLRELHRGGATICMVTHDPRYAAHADRSVHLFDGRVVEESRPGQAHA